MEYCIYTIRLGEFLNCLLFKARRQAYVSFLDAMFV